VLDALPLAGTIRFHLPSAPAGSKKAPFIILYSFRSLTRRTNFSPDQISVTAHIFTSTSPASSPTPRTTFSSTSVATPELFFGQLTHNIPAGASLFAIRENSLANSVRDFVNIIAKSSESESFTTLHSANASRNSAHTSAGVFAILTRNPVLIPNFFGSGVPEYPGILIACEKDRVTQAETRKPEAVFSYCTGA
jgi:hypothetical protein